MHVFRLVRMASWSTVLLAIAASAPAVLALGADEARLVGKDLSTWRDAYSDEKPTGPLMLQGDHGPVAYRNIRLKALDGQP